ncbi:hypothetical protein [Acetobacter sp.]|jgi:hypothetical protein|uniref:hypothetical protein n=1 Tax=Acetobacter sp. TaxID=440 RepID=UPI0025B89A74|nr:hypothetical protein [Acetobacter sp.]MCH4091665.1 hypothetical protein [Acetobacter sp.]MCI1300917.1 hypothetical protein [Acetobacter sp.]MCI1316206.1 hypothetical protein [Acetobacter sp.]
MSKKPTPAETSAPAERVRDPHIHIAASEDFKQATLTITSGRKKIVLDLNAAQVADLITGLGAVHQAMVGANIPPIEGVSFTPVRRTNWALQLDPESQGSILAFQHPAYGPIGLAMTPADAAKVAHGLSLHQQLNAATLKASGPAN